MSTRWDHRFFASTRGQIVALLRRDSRTVDEMAQVLGLTDNAVRAHLATLERDGLVQQRGVRRGIGKPAYAYELTPDAERLFPKAYGPVLSQLLDVLSDQMSPEELEELLRRVGHRIAAAHTPASGDLLARLEVAVDVLNELGGLAELEERDDAFVIRGYSCPLAAAVPGHPAVCSLAETLLTDLVGVPVQECCDRGSARAAGSRWRALALRPRTRGAEPTALAVTARPGRGDQGEGPKSRALS
jgi:predicted ArsR family transcriptional regulator